MVEGKARKGKERTEKDGRAPDVFPQVALLLLGGEVGGLGVLDVHELDRDLTASALRQRETY